MSTDPDRSPKGRLKTRLNHLERLGNPEHGLTVPQANQAFIDVYEAGSKPKSILIRRSFVARARRIHVAGEHDKTPRQKPALATAVQPRGVTLKLEMTLLFLAQCATRVSAQIAYPVQSKTDDQLGLIDFLSTGSQPRENTEFRRSRPGMRARQVANALNALAAPDLQLAEVGHRASGKVDTSASMWLNRETGPKTTGDVRRYGAPGRQEAVISIPIEFFTRGWLQVMTDSEIANWLMWRDQGEMRDAAVTTADDLFLEAQDRLDIYDLTRDAWDTHQMLTRLGLMTVTVGEVEARMTTRGTRFHRDPHHFGVDDTPLGQDGHAAMLAAVAAQADDI